MSDYDLIEARFTISKIQTALDTAARLRKMQTTIGALNELAIMRDRQITNLALDLSLERLRGAISDKDDDARSSMEMKAAPLV